MATTEERVSFDDDRKRHGKLRESDGRGVQVSLYLGRYVYGRVQIESRKQGISRNEFIRAAIRSALAAREDSSDGED